MSFRRTPARSCDSTPTQACNRCALTIAYYCDGSIATCEAVPSSLVRRLPTTLTPEEFFSLHIASQYDCEVVTARGRNAPTRARATN